jgi:hypothetical protein
MVRTGARRWRTLIVYPTVLGLTWLSACGDASDRSDDSESARIEEFEIDHAIEADPFCDEMLSIADSNDLTGVETAERYRDLILLVPAVLSSDFQALIETLSTPIDEGGLADGSGADADAEVPAIDPDIDDSLTGEVPPEPLTPGEVVAAWVDTHCRATAISPLPQPSSPD